MATFGAEKPWRLSDDAEIVRTRGASYALYIGGFQRRGPKMRLYHSVFLDQEKLPHDHPDQEDGGGDRLQVRAMKAMGSGDFAARL